MRAFRIADARHPIFDPTGAMLHGGRWNSPGTRVIYAAETYAGAMLEVLVHANLAQPPKNHRVVQIEIPGDLAYKTILADELPGWSDPDMLASRAAGDAWIRSGRTAVLFVPSVITGGRENNLLLNTQHPDFPRIRASAPEPVAWDARLFLHPVT